MKMAVPRKAAPPRAPTKAQSISENCRARNSDKKEGGQRRRRRSEICREMRKARSVGPGEGAPNSRRTKSSGPAERGGLEDHGKPHGLTVERERAKTKCHPPGGRSKMGGAWHRAQTLHWAQPLEVSPRLGRQPVPETWHLPNRTPGAAERQCSPGQ